MLWWTDELLTGISVVDKQHKEIFDRAEEIMNFEEDSLKENVKESFDYLIDYVKYHFKSEEEVMIKYCYDNLDNHKNAHASLMESLYKLHEHFLLEGTDQDLLDDFKVLIIKWLINHIDIEDKKFASFVRSVKN